MTAADCDHIIGWLHCLNEPRGIRPNGEGPPSPRPISLSEAADLVEAHRAYMAQVGFTYRTCRRSSDEQIINSKVDRFKFCPRCGCDLWTVSVG